MFALLALETWSCISKEVWIGKFPANITSSMNSQEGLKYYNNRILKFQEECLCVCVYNIFSIYLKNSFYKQVFWDIYLKPCEIIEVVLKPNRTEHFCIAFALESSILGCSGFSFCDLWNCSLSSLRDYSLVIKTKWGYFPLFVLPPHPLSFWNTVVCPLHGIFSPLDSCFSWLWPGFATFN